MQTRFGSSRLETLPKGASQLAPHFASELAPHAETPAAGLVFDGCHVGVILRAVLFVQLVMAVGVLYASASFWDWLSRLAVVTAAALPATLVWLVVTCAFKKRLQALSPMAQWCAGIFLGALAGVYGCALMAFFGAVTPISWLASSATGALSAAVLVAALMWRAAGRAPAAANARLAELQSRIRPHFLFNTLNSAIALVRAEPAKAEAVLEDLSELFRSALVDRGDSVTLGQEIALAQRYLDIEKVRFGERLRVRWALDEAADLAQLPPLLLQPLVENAVKHGVEPSASGAEIKVSTQRRGSTVVLKVTNTLPAGHGQSGHGVALRNVRDRLRLLHDVQASFQAIQVDGIYQVRIEVPA